MWYVVLMKVLSQHAVFSQLSLILAFGDFLPYLSCCLWMHKLQVHGKQMVLNVSSGSVTPKADSVSTFSARTAAAKTDYLHYNEWQNLHFLPQCRIQSESPHRYDMLCVVFFPSWPACQT